KCAAAVLSTSFMAVDSQMGFGRLTTKLVLTNAKELEPHKGRKIDFNVDMTFALLGLLSRIISPVGANFRCAKAKRAVFKPAPFDFRFFFGASAVFATFDFSVCGFAVLGPSR
ncbi:MAG TPA: hypothetical protein VE170_12840, partial [Candidatus Limnocylindria bacterium]|nr:hypothetical protein [Candidatus Limnocylindria bacterium]